MIFLTWGGRVLDDVKMEEIKLDREEDSQRFLYKLTLTKDDLKPGDLGYENPTEVIKFEAILCDNHYVLMRTFPPFIGFELYGVSEKDKPEKADKRLHGIVKKVAEEMAKKYGILSLIDNTPYAPESLPRGGK